MPLYKQTVDGFKFDPADRTVKPLKVDYVEATPLEVATEHLRLCEEAAADGRPSLVHPASADGSRVSE